MSELFQQTQATAQWQSLVKEAESQSGVRLNEELESYLVFLLMRYTEKPDMVNKVMALEYLHGVQAAGRTRQHQLREVGDQCLLYSGLFPRRAERRMVRISYYVDLGRSAYQHVADLTHKAMSDMFAQLAAHFIEMMDTLQTMRTLNKNNPEILDPIRAFELWNDTGSRRARRVLAEHSHAIPVWQENKTPKRH